MSAFFTLKKSTILILSSLAFAVPAYAQQVICKSPEDVFCIVDMVAWDTKSRIASMRTPFDEVYKGTVTLIRRHSNIGYKTNLEFPIENSIDKTDLWEIIVFPLPDGRFNAIGAAYNHINGSRCISHSIESLNMNCTTL